LAATFMLLLAFVLLFNGKGYKDYLWKKGKNRSCLNQCQQKMFNQVQIPADNCKYKGGAVIADFIGVIYTTE